MASNKIQTGIRLKPEILYKLHYIANINNRSFNGQAETAIEKFVKEYEAENGTITEDEYYKNVKP